MPAACLAMRLLTRYILREVITHAILGGLVFTFILFSSRLGAILEIWARNSASVADIARLVLYFLPEALIVTVPMAVLVGILLGLSRLAADSEITAMRAAGMGAFQFVRIISIVSIFALVLSLFNTLFLAPRAAASLLALEDSLKYAQASFEVQPRVFDEDFRNLVLYVQDVRTGAGVALWRHVFLADVTEPATPKITTAEEALVTSGGPGDLHLLMRNGGQHQISPANPNQYNISTFTTTDLPIQSGSTEDAHISRSDTRIGALSLRELLQRAQTQSYPADGARKARPYRIEFNRRFSYPFACLVLMLVGVPLGLSSRRGGKSTGFVVTILLVFIYYFLSTIGVALANQGRVSALVGVWGANFLFGAAGVLLLQQMSRGGIALSLLSSVGAALSGFLVRLRRSDNGLVTGRAEEQPDLSTQLPQRLRSILHIRFPLIVDDYIMRSFAANVALVIASFSILFLVFTFFELIGDIIRNRTPLVTVGSYLLNLIPFILYNVTPLCVLVAVLITFGTLARTSEFIALKAAGFSLYRIITPVLVLTTIIAAGLFTFENLYLPAANRRQESLRAVIKGRPAQTFLRPDRQWISGQTSAPSASHLSSELWPPNSPQLPSATAQPARIFYYQFFDPDRNVFANLTVFEFDPVTFSLRRRIFAASTHWDPEVNQWLFENGWVRSFNISAPERQRFGGETIATYQPFVLQTFPEIREQPAYFKKEFRPSQEMNFSELSAYINDLRQSGFETRKLAVQLNRKLAYPLITVVMAVLAIPFALSTGKRSGVTGFAIAILLAVFYLGVASFFEAMGNVNQLPPTLAAWSPDLLFSLAGAWFLLRTST